MYCKNCGGQVNDNAAVCLHCGVKVGSGSKFCPVCGAQPDPMAVVCVACGAPLNQHGVQGAEGIVNSFGVAIKTCFNKFATFQGRANRSEFWFWWLFTLLLGFIPLIGLIALFVTLVPSISVAVRRLHDIGKSGWWYWLCLIPLFGWIALIVLYCQESEPGTNEYGPNPNLQY